MERRVLERLERLGRVTGKSRLMSAQDAVRLITPGSVVHLATTHSVPFGLAYELTRQFWGQQPHFVLVCLGAGVNAQVMLRDPGFLDRIITSYAGNVYPSPSPATVFQENYRSGSVTIENWSLLTLTQRLMAGALGLSFMPTNSLSATSIEIENSGSGVARVPSPFDDRPQVVVSPLVPDYTLVHGWAADPSGNVLARPPRSEANYGAMAARRGVIASVDRIVDISHIRRYSEDLLITSSRTLAVVEMPYGAHPSPSRGYPPDWGYAEDEQFLLDFRTASRSLEELDKWIQRWVLRTDHEQYLARLGPRRLKALSDRASPRAWRRETQIRTANVDWDAPATPNEQMILAMADLCVERVREQGYETILAGQGTSNLAAWVAYYRLAAEGIHVSLMAEIGLYGYSPLPPQPLIFNSANITTCEGVGTCVDILGVQVSGARRHQCIALLSAAKSDQYGNVDSTCIPELKTWLLGSGGACDVLSCAEEIVLCCPQDLRRLWPEVPYITGRGDHVSALVTTRAVFKRRTPAGPLLLSTLIRPAMDSQSTVEEMTVYVQENTGWDISPPPDVIIRAMPTRDELRILRMFDPEMYYLR